MAARQKELGQRGPGVEAAGQLVLRQLEREGGEGGGRAVVRDVMRGRKEVVYLRLCSLVVEAPGGEAAMEGEGARMAM